MCLSLRLTPRAVGPDAPAATTPPAQPRVSRGPCIRRSRTPDGFPWSTPTPDWAHSPDHYPRLKADGGHLVSWNVRLSHVLCNREDYGWRMRIRRMLEKGMSLEEIAENLNHKGIRRPHGSATWSATSVRKAFVS